MEESNPRQWKGMRWIVAVVIACLAAPAIYVTPLAAGLGGVGSAVLTALATLALIAFLARALPNCFATANPSSRWLLGCWVLVSLYAGYELTRLSFYIGDIDSVEYAINPPVREFDDPDLAKPFFVKHCCFTCYVVGAYLASDGTDNIYDRVHYRKAEVETPIHKVVGEKLNIDQYQYPPPFLLLPAALRATGGDFFQVRAYWHTLNVVVFLVTSVLLANWLSKGSFRAVWLMIPAVLVTPTALSTLQVGNAHFLIMCLSILAMFAFEKNHNAIGAGLLGYTVLSKLFPGVLIVYLILRRRWRAVGWICAAMVVYLALTLAIFGSAPYKAFFDYQLPRLISGEAFSFAFEYYRAKMVNSSVMGAVYKLSELGLIGSDQTAAIAKIAVWIYTAVLLLVAGLLGWRHARVATDLPDDASDSSNRRLAIAQVWFVLLILGQFRSPFLPWGYGNVIILWFMALLLERGSVNGCCRVLCVVATLVVWLGLAISVPLPIGPPQGSFDLIYTLAFFAITIVITSTVSLRQILGRSIRTVAPLNDSVENEANQPTINQP